MKIYDEIEKYTFKNDKKIALIQGEQKVSYGRLKKETDSLAEELKRNFYPSEILKYEVKDNISGIIFLLAASKAGLKTVLADESLPRDYFKEVINKGTINKKENIFLGVLSSGSTGNPKLIWRTHESWCKAFPVQSDCFKLGEGDSLFLAGSLIYSANLNSALHMLNLGGTVVFSSSKFPKTWVAELKRNNVSAIFMVPANYRILLKTIGERISGVRVLISAGEKMDLKTFMNLIHIFEDPFFFEYYGAAEMGHISWADKEDFVKKPLSVGKAFPGVDINIDNSRIWVKSPYAALGFEGESTIKDLGHVDEEGYLFLEGREGNIINKGGIKIVPGDLEKIIKEIPEVEDVIVLGKENFLRGQTVISFILKEKISDLNESEIKNYLRKKVPKGAVPQRILFLNDFPRNKSGKIDFKLLKNMI